MLRILKWGVILSFAQVLFPLLTRIPEARAGAFVFGCGLLACMVLGRIVGPIRTEIIFRGHYATRSDW